MTPEKVIYITWLSVALCFSWPLPVGSGRNKVFGFKILQVATVISAIMMLLPLMYSIYLHLDDMVIVSKSFSAVTSVSQIAVHTFICFIKQDSFQRVIGEMVTYVKEAQQYEREIFCKYIARCSTLYGSCMLFAYVTVTIFLLGPVILSTSFPLDAEYPFNVNYTPVNAIIYLHQSIVCCQCAANICLCISGALLLWFTAARFECLAVEFKKSSNIDMVITCVKKQLHLRRYANEVINSFRFLILYTTIVTTFTITLSCIIVFMNPPLIVKMQFMAACLTVLTEIYMYAWPADHMKDMSANVSQSVYDITWYEQTLEMQKDLLNVLVYQKPVIISITYLVPELSLRYYCSYLSNAFSIFNSLRILLSVNNSAQ
ncbi:odorant receptor 22c-like [Bombus affinis]|uniref:odorant receptor 22c-like n=1 Tax=Bombus affinis TaxID=309941 RepID=UPI0021B7CAE6|nr:odorant receptor 22c-like [Bombus affinis]